MLRPWKHAISYHLPHKASPLFVMNVYRVVMASRETMNERAKPDEFFTR